MRLITALMLVAVTAYGQGTQTPIYNGLLQSDLNAAGFKILSSNMADYAGTGMTWNVVTGKFDVTGGGGGGSGTVTSLTATAPIVVAPSPIVSTGVISLDSTSKTNWDTAYTDRMKWDGGATGLTAATGRTSLGLVIGTNVEAYLGNPSVNGYVLSSTTGGVRSWVVPATGGGGTWGSITGTLSSQTDLQTALDAKLATLGDLSPLFTTTEATQNGAFSLTSAAATTVFGRAAGTSGAPTYSSAPQFLKIGNLTTNGFVKTGSSDGTLSVDTATYLTTATAASTYQPLDTDLTTFAGITPTTVGQSFLTLTNPGAITFPEISATNVVSAKTAAQLKTDLSITSTDVGLGSVTNNAQTQAAIVPNTAPSAGQILIGNAGNTAYAKNSLSGSGATMSLGATGVLTISAIPESSLSITNVTTGDATTSAHGFAPKGTVGTTQFWRQDWTLATPTVGGNVSNSGTPTVDQLGIWVTSTTIKGLTTLPATNFPALTGDVTTTAGALGTTIGANKVTLGMMATMSTDSILGRKTAATGNVEELTALPFAYTGDVTRPVDSNVTTLAAGNAGNLNSGTLLAARMPAFTGDVTSSVGTVANTLVNIPLTTTIAGVAGTRGDVLYYGASGWAKLAAGTNGNQLTTHAAGADPTWDAPASGGTGTPGGSDTYVQFNDASAFGGDAGLTYNKTTDTLTSGIFYGANGSPWSTPQFGTAGVNTGFSASGSLAVLLSNGDPTLVVSPTEARVANDTYIGFASTTDPWNQTIDTGFYRNAAGVVEINNGTAGTYRDLKLRTVNVTSDIQVNGIATGIDYLNSSVSSQTPSTSDVYLVGSNVVVPAGAFKAKGQYRCLFDVVKSAGTGTIVLSLRIGTTGTVASDTARITFTFPAGTSVADTGNMEVIVNWRTVGSGTSAVVSGLCRAFKNTITAAGLWNDTSAAKTIVGTVSGGFASDTATNIGLSFNGGTAFAGTITTVQSSLLQ